MGKNHLLEKALFLWICDQFNRRILLSQNTQMYSPSVEGEWASEIETGIELTPLEKQIEAIALIKLAAEQRMIQDP